MSILLCFSQNFVNDLHEKDSAARLEAIAHPNGGHRLIVTHQIEEEKLEELKSNFPELYDLNVMATVPEGEKPKHLFYERASIHYHPLKEWQKSWHESKIAEVKANTKAKALQDAKMRIIARKGKDADTEAVDDSKKQQPSTISLTA